MKEKENVHAGHRERTIENFLKNTDGFSDHQILEILLFFVLPRVDTNPLSHRLLKYFGDLKGVFSATNEQLLMVDGVGNKTAAFILSIGKVLQRIEGKKQKELLFSTPKATKDYFINLFDGAVSEKFVLLLLDKKYKLLRKIEFADNDKNRVSAELPEVVSAINIYKPTYAIVAHNHLSGNCLPSKEDDFATKKLNLICDLHDINLLDHVIVSGKQCYSYKDNDLLEKIKKENSLVNFLGE